MLNISFGQNIQCFDVKLVGMGKLFLARTGGYTRTVGIKKSAFFVTWPCPGPAQATSLVPANDISTANKIGNIPLRSNSLLLSFNFFDRKYIRCHSILNGG